MMKPVMSKKPMTSMLKGVLAPYNLSDNNVLVTNIYHKKHLKMYVTATFDTESNRTAERISGFHIRANFNSKNFMHTHERDLFEIISSESKNSSPLRPNWEKMWAEEMQPEYISLNFERTQLWRYLVLLTDPELKAMFSWCLVQHGFDKIVAKTKSEQAALLKITIPDVQIILK